MNESERTIESTSADKIAYLQLLQEPISRMSSTASIFKGFSAAILAGLASASFTGISQWALLIGLIPIVAFLFMDVYYLSLERKLKYRYRMVVENNACIDFSINTKLTKEEKKSAKSCPLLCVLSYSIWMFYAPTIGCAVVLFVLKVTGTI